MGPRRDRLVTVLVFIAGAVSLVLVIAAGLLFWFDLEPDHTERTQGFVDDLYLHVTPRPAERGEVVSFFVQGEPPIRLRARRYADLLSEDGDSLFRLDTAAAKRRPPEAAPYPLPAAYDAPSGAVALQERQAVRLPEELEPGRYTLQAYIFGRDRLFDDNARYEGTPSWSFPILASR